MARPIVGLDIGSRSIKGIKLDDRRKSPLLLDFAMETLPPEAIKDGEIINEELVTEALRKIAGQLRPSRCKMVAAISGEQAIVRNIKMPKMNRNEIREALPWQLDEYLSFPLEEAVMDFVIEKENETEEGQELDIMAVATRRKNVENILKPLKNAGFKPDRVNLQTFALYYILKFMGKEKDNLALADIGASATDLILMSEGLIEQHRTLPLGGENFTRALASELRVSEEEAEKIKVEELADKEEEIAELDISFGDLADEFSRSLAHFSIQHRGLEIEKLYLTGGASQTAGLLESINNRVDVPVDFLKMEEVLTLGRRINQEAFSEIQSRFFVSLGLALSEVKE